MKTTPTDRVHRLIYLSRAANIHSNSLATFRSILEQSQVNNMKAGITGFLAFDRLQFIQILEGTRSTVWRTFQTIQTDPRHQEIDLIEFVGAENRFFLDWSMAGSLRTPLQDAIYDRHGFPGRVRPEHVTAAKLLPLAHDVLSLTGLVAHRARN